jgi:hypothetical protein
MEDLIARHCPYCGEPIELLVDGSHGAQEYIEDCPVCCRPMRVALHVDADGLPDATLLREDDA